MIKDWLDRYKPTTQEQADHALREIMQEAALAGLQRSGFFEKAAFYGGTALRIFHGLDRFSEDLDFSLLQIDPDFNLQLYLDPMVTEFEALGMSVTVKEKTKSRETSIDSAFLKSDTAWRELLLDDIIPQAGLKNIPALKIKLEVDTEPPSGFSTEENLLINPFSFYVKCFAKPDLFAGKMHALLFRKWKNRVKGRDWYDLEWYVRNGIPLNLSHLAERARDSGDWNKRTMSRKEFSNLLRDKIESVSFDQIQQDIVRFIPDPSKLEIWSSRYFADLSKLIKFQ